MYARDTKGQMSSALFRALHVINIESVALLIMINIAQRACFLLRLQLQSASADFNETSVCAPSRARLRLVEESVLLCVWTR